MGVITDDSGGKRIVRKCSTVQKRFWYEGVVRNESTVRFQIVSRYETFLGYKTVLWCIWSPCFLHARQLTSVDKAKDCLTGNNWSDPEACLYAWIKLL